MSLKGSKGKASPQRIAHQGLKYTSMALTSMKGSNINEGLKCQSMAQMSIQGSNVNKGLKGQRTPAAYRAARKERTRAAVAAA